VPRHLFIVDRQQLDLFSYLSREFSAEPEVTVMLDRRQGERRRSRPRADASERRRAERRARAEVGGDLSTLGYAFVRIS
jgi:hypothetical protein